MFIQVIQGKVRDADRLQRCMDRWTEALMPGAVGYLGTTAGMADDGTFVALARFESADAARANSERPEQGEWWTDTAQCFEGEITFMDCNEVTPWLSGGSDDAKFVQIMAGRSTDVSRMHELMNSRADEVHQARPEIIGAMMMDAGDGRFVDAIYFTSEEDARRGEKLDMPEDMRADFEESMALMGEVAYLDLHHPMMVSAR